MRIAQINIAALPTIGGAEFAMHHLSRAWHRRGHEVRIFNAETADASLAEGAYTVRKCTLLRGATRFGYHRFPWLEHAAFRFQRALDAYRPDALFVHHGYPSATWVSAMRPVPRFFVTCHGGELAKFPWGDRARYKMDKALARSLKAAAGVFAISTYARALIEELGVVPSRIHDIPNGVDLERFERALRAGALDVRAKLGLPKDALVVLSVGRAHPQKAFEIGIEAFARAQRPENAYYVILGKGVDMYRPVAERTGVDHRVIFHQGLYGDELVAAYQQADLFYLPSVFELFALVLLEAMAAGLPALVTDVSGSQDVIETGKNGVVVPPGKVEPLADALSMLLADAPLRARLGAANRVKIQDYSWDRVADMYLRHV